MSLPGINVMLLGASGAGKTYSLRTLVKAGITPMCVFTEPGFEVLGDIPCPQLHWRYLPPAPANWAALIDSAQKINTLSLESLAKLSDINKAKHAQYIDLLKTLSNFKCDRCGQEFGAADSWGTDRAVVLDSLSGVNVMAMSLVVGSKPVKSQSDWGIAQDNLERLVMNLCVNTRAHFILLAHSEREVDEVMGGAKIMASTLGRKLAPKLPRFFSDVVLAVKEGAKFSWSTAAVGADLKARNLPIADNLPPDFAPMLENWKKHGGKILTDEKAA